MTFFSLVIRFLDKPKHHNCTLKPCLRMNLNLVHSEYCCCVFFLVVLLSLRVQATPTPHVQHFLYFHSGPVGCYWKRRHCLTPLCSRSWTGAAARYPSRPPSHPWSLEMASSSVLSAPLTWTKVRAYSSFTLSSVHRYASV